MGKIFFLLFFIFFSCNSRPDNKRHLLIEKNNDGKIISKLYYYLTKSGDSIVDGIVIHYYPNGNIEDSSNVVNGKKEGAYFQYDSTGYLRGILKFKNGKSNGYCYSYFKNKNVEIEGLYRNDSLLYNKNYYENGRLKSYFIMESNKNSCYYILLDSLGKIITESGDSTTCKSKRGR